MKKLLGIFWFFSKVWVLACLLLVSTQVRIKGETILTQINAYCSKPKIAKHFAQLLYPVHWALEKVGINVGRENIETVIAYTQSNEEKIKDTFGAEAGMQMEKMKKAAEAQKAVLESIEKDLE